MKRGDEVVRAIHAYREVNGSPPVSLDLLVPSQLNKLPLPAAGTRRWQYITHLDGRNFCLIFSRRESEFPYMSYLSNVGKWEMQTSD